MDEQLITPLKRKRVRTLEACTIKGFFLTVNTLILLDGIRGEIKGFAPMRNNSDYVISIKWDNADEVKKIPIKEFKELPFSLGYGVNRAGSR